MSASGPIIEETSWWRRLHSDPAVFATALPRQDCVDRLRAAVGPSWKYDRSRPVVGRVTKTGALLRRQTRGRNNLTTMVALKFLDQGDGTRIVANFGVGTLMFALMMGWSLLVISAVAAFIVVKSDLPVTDVAFLPIVLVPVAMIAAIVVVAVTVKKQGPENRQALTDFIRATLDATEVKDIA